MAENSYTVISYYKFFEIKNIFNFKNRLMKSFNDVNVKGIILIAPEGININISILTSEYIQIMNNLSKLFNFNNIDLKIIKTHKHIFRKFKVKIKKEILTTRDLSKTSPSKQVGKYVDAENWDKLINDPNTVLVDMRNDYEVKIGTFKNAINPKCSNFSELLSWLKNDFIKLKNLSKKNVAMFCTGGIRCEKASAYLLNIGKKNVYHLQGGILKYLETSKSSKTWKGECFVFDDRVSLDKNLQPGTYSTCHACRMPLTAADKRKKEYKEGEACHLCYNIKNEAQRSKYRMRNKQINLSKHYW